MKIPFLTDKTRVIAEVSQDTMEGSDIFWIQFFLMWIVGGVLWGLDAFGHVKIGDVDGVWWFMGAGLIAGVYAGGQKFFDDQKRHSPRWSSAGFEGSVRVDRAVFIAERWAGGKLLWPRLIAVPEGFSHIVHYMFARGVKLIERADAVFEKNPKHLDSNTASREYLWDELPEHVQEALRSKTARRSLKIKFIGGDWRFGRPLPGTRFVFGDKPLYAVFCDEPFELDTVAETQRAHEAMARSSAERLGSDGVEYAQRSARLHAANGLSRAKRGRPPAGAEEQEEESSGLE